MRLWTTSDIIAHHESKPLILHRPLHFYNALQTQWVTRILLLRASPSRTPSGLTHGVCCTLGRVSNALSRIADGVGEAFGGVAEGITHAADFLVGKNC